MLNLLLTLIGISLFVLFALSGVNHISYDGIQSNDQSNRILASITKVSGSILSYWSYYDEYPESISQMIPDIINTLPKISFINNSNYLLDPIGIDASYVINKTNGKVNICLGSNKISNIEALSLSKTVSALSKEKVSFHISCSSIDTIPLNLIEIENGNYESVNAQVVEGDSFWMKYYLIGSAN